MATMPPVANLQAFEAVARRRSFALAAAELHLSASAVSHQVARLEAQLGVRLFERNAHQVKLSAAGQRYLARVGGALAAIASASDDAQRGESNSLYLHVSPSLAALWLMPRLPSFTQRHPDIAMHFSASPTHSEFALGQADLDIRYGVPQWPDLQVQALFEERIVPLAHPGFVAAHKIKRAQQLLQLPLIQSTVSVVQWADWFTHVGAGAAPERFVLRFDRAMMSLDAAAHGLGVALESSTMASRHLREGRLKPVFNLIKAVKVQAHFAVYPARHAQRPPVVKFLAWLKAQAQEG